MTVQFLCREHNSEKYRGFPRAFQKRGIRVEGVDDSTPLDVDLRRLIDRCEERPSLVLQLESNFPLLPRGLTEVDIPTLCVQSDTYAYTRHRIRWSMLFDYAVVQHPGFEDQFRGSPDAIRSRLLEYVPIFDGARDVIRSFRDEMATAPDDCTMQMMLTRHADTGAPVASVIVCNSGTDSEPPALRRLRESPHLLEDRVARIPYRKLQAMLDMPFGLRNYWKGHFVRELPDELVELLVERYGALGWPPGAVLIEALHGAATRVAADATAVSFRAASFNISALAVWEQPEQDEAEIGWARETAASIEPWSVTGGGYLNYMQHDEPLERVRAAFGAEKFERLRALKRAYDPQNVFSHNQNIPPA